MEVNKKIKKVVREVGGSSVITIPYEVIKVFGIENGDELELELINIRKAKELTEDNSP